MTVPERGAVCDYWVQYLLRLPGPVYAVLDAARDPDVRTLGGRSLYDGDRAVVSL